MVPKLLEELEASESLEDRETALRRPWQWRRGLRRREGGWRRVRLVSGVVRFEEGRTQPQAKEEEVELPV